MATRLSKQHTAFAEVNEVAEEASATLIVGEIQAGQTDTTGLPKVTVLLLEEVCREIAEDRCLRSETRALIKALDCTILQERLQVFDSCLGPRGKFSNVAREKAYAKYYATFCKHHASFTEVTKSAKASGIVTLKLFKKLVKAAYGGNTENPTQSPAFVSDDEKDIVRYVAGSIVKKLKKRVWVLKGGDYREDMLRCLEALSHSDPPQGSADASSTDMTSILNRGGLTFVKDKIFNMFLEMEGLFRKYVGGEGSVNVAANDSDFVKDCLASEMVPVCFYDTVDACDDNIPLVIQETVLENAACLFFKIRVHHKLKIMMDRVQRGWREKSMRKRLRPIDNSV